MKALIRHYATFSGSLLAFAIVWGIAFLLIVVVPFLILDRIVNGP